MKKVLFLSESYYPVTTPNGVCLRMVSQQMIRDGYEVHVLCLGSLETTTDIVHEGVCLHYVRPNLFLRLREYGEQNPDTGRGKRCYKVAMLLNKVQKLFMLPWYPLNHPRTLNRFVRASERLYRQHGFDRVIGVYCPLEATLAAIKFKRKHPEVPVGIYILDSLIYMSGTEYFPPQIAEKLKWRLEKKVYEGADAVFNMRCHEVHHHSDRYDPYRSKMVFLDIPLFEPMEETGRSFPRIYDETKVQWTYMGTLFENYREPYYMCRIAEALSDTIPVQIQFYTRGSCEDKVADMCRQAPERYVQHGYVSNDRKEEIYDNSDFLINIGVNRTTMISSKIFDYMAYGKPIIHFYYQDDDVNNPYLENYPLCCLVQMKEELLEENIRKVKNFIKEFRGKTLNSSFLLERFTENTPRFTADAFERFSCARF